MFNSTEHEIKTAHKVKMPKIVGILTFISRINTTSESFKARKPFDFQQFVVISSLIIMLCWVEHEKKHNLGARLSGLVWIAPDSMFKVTQPRLNCALLMLFEHRCECFNCFYSSLLLYYLK